MQPKISHLATALVGAVAALASVSGMACTLAPANPVRIKQLMANEIAHRLGLRPQQIPFDAITEPRLITPLGLGADCSGLGGYHHSAGFRIRQPGPGPWPGTGPDGGPRPGWPPGGGPRPWPGQGQQCVYEGAVVVLGYGYSSPVSVNFERRCR